MSVLREIRIQTDTSATTRTETYMGREYLVAPVIMLVEGVLQGANAENPEFVPAEAIEKLSHQWNGRPVVMNHPQVQGTYVSANDPEILENWAFGFVFNTAFEDDKLKAEAWIDIQRAEDLGGDFQDAVDRINAGEVVEISTGLFCDIIEKKGRFNSKRYSGVWVNVISDHLAILSDGLIGACSVEGGCGIPRINQEPSKGPWGDRPLEMRINTAALRTFTPADDHDGHCCETCKGAAMPKANNDQTTTDEVAEPVEPEAVVTADAESAAPVEVVEPTAEELTVLQARSAFAVNAIPDTLTNEDANKLVRAALASKLNRNYVWVQAMTRDIVVYEQYAEGYCCGSGYKTYSLGYTIGEDNAVTFDGEPQEVVLTTKITPVVNEAEGVQPASGTLAVNSGADPMSQGNGHNKPETGTSVPVAPDPASGDGGTGSIQVNNDPAAAALAVTPQTVDAWLASAPPEVANIIRAQMGAADTRKKELITSIKANSANTFSDAALESFDNATLEGISKLSVNASPAADDDRVDPLVRYNYAGRGGLAVNSAVSDDEQQRINADSNKNGAPKVHSAFQSAEDFGPRVGAFRSK